MAFLGLPFTFSSPDVDETLDDTLPLPVAMERVAMRKALAAREKAQGKCAVIAADTVVVLDGAALGKPEDAVDAGRMLRALSGKTHECVSAVCALLPDGRSQAAHEIVRVTFAPLTEREITEYIRTGEPLDKAGAYGIQGRGGAFIERIEGDYYAVVGLPLCLLRKMLNSVADAAEAP